MKNITSISLLIVVFASVCSLDRSVPDCAIMGKWVGAGGAVLVSVLVVSITALFTHGNKGGTAIRAGDMSWAFALAGIAVLVHCVLQLSGVMKHTNGGGPGVYAAVAGFDNPAGVAAALTVCLPFLGYLSLTGNYRHSSPVRIVAYAVFLLSLILLAVIGSRAGVIAVGVALVLFLVQGTGNVRLRRALLIAAVAAVAVIAVALSVQKRASSTGRMLILNVCWDMIKERPLLGHGLHGFRSQYMIYQALFLDRCRSEVMDMLADNVTHPLNEYVLLASRMCPVRYIPLYGLFCLYEEQGRFDEMKSIGQAILNKRIKVKSAEISRLRLSVRQKMLMNNLLTAYDNY